MQKIEAIIYDMDGVIIDSEPFWHASETFVFQSLGVKLTPEMTQETVGLRIKEVVEYWHRRFDWQGPSEEAIAMQIAHRVESLIREQGVALPGALESMALFRASGLRLALATSSPPSMIEAVCARLHLGDQLEIRRSAHYLDYGKPHPEVYLETAEALGVAPTACLAIEDSVNGVISAKAAQMQCLAVPAAAQWGDRRFGIADYTLPSLEGVDPAFLTQLGLTPGA